MSRRRLDKRQRGAEYRHHQRNFSNSMSKALYLATKRPVSHGIVTFHCEKCSIELLKARQAGREIYLCLKCGAIVNPGETIQEAVNE